MNRSNFINQRSTSIEILRIISMLLIVLSHYNVHGEIQLNEISLTFNKVIMQFSNTGNLGVDIFLIITGYFLVESTFNLKKYLKILNQVIFYSTILYLLLIMFNYITFDISEFIFNLIPLISNQYWFVTAYIVIYLTSPFLNAMLKKLKKKEYLKFLFIITIIWSIVPTFVLISDNYSFYGSEIPQFVMLYSIGAYLHLYPIKKEKGKKVGILLSSFSAISSLTLYVCINILRQKVHIFEKWDINFFFRNSVFVIMFALGLFLIFENSTFKYNAKINSIAKCTFGVYLIHDNSYVRSILWQNLLSNKNYIDSPFLIVHMIVCTLLVFVVCTFFEWVRIHFIEAPLFKVMDKPIYKLNFLINKSFNYIYNKINTIIYDKTADSC